MCNVYELNHVDYCEDFRSFITYLQERYNSRDAVSVYDRSGNITTLSYQEFSTKIIQLAAYFQQRGYDHKHCAIVAENSPEWLISAFALAYIGSVSVCIDTEQADETIIKMITQADCTVVLYSNAFKDLWGKLKGEYDLLNISDPAFFDQMTEQGANDSTALEMIRTKKIDPCACSFIYYTSGTTSTSKPVMLSQRAILYNAIDSMALVKVSGKLYTSLPFYHTYGLTCSVLDVLSQGLSICINGNMKTSLRDLVLFSPDYLMAVPLLVETIYKYITLEINKLGKIGEFEDFLSAKPSLFKSSNANYEQFREVIEHICGKQLKMIVCGGAHLSDKLIRKFDRMNIMVLQGYGITECAPLVSVNRNCQNEIGSVGQIMPHYHVKIVDNEIYVKGDSLMLGYYKDEQLTQEAFDGDWFRTGDIGYQNKQGFLYITGRKKNLIVFKNGKKTSPEEIESYLYNIPYVKEVIAYGAVNGISVDDVKLSVTIYPDPILTAGMAPYEILDLLQNEINGINQSLPAYKQIQMVKISENPLPKTSLNKIRRS
ncbi:MAG: AMP-binding protein [Erysipelotrichaceae bacterium]|nr:AMP-binding protein [Erysipelotrichaceae bacterium]